MNEKLKEYKIDKNKNNSIKKRIERKRTIRMEDFQKGNITTCSDELKTIKNDISRNINECFEKKKKI